VAEAADWLHDRLGCALQRRELLQRALTHRSCGPEHNERLEFLGDAVLALVVSERLVADFPAATEGELSRRRASLVSGTTLGALALELGVDHWLRLGAGARRSGVERRPSILAGALEALIGAIYLDGGLDAARLAIGRIFADRFAELAAAGPQQDPKTCLQEWLQARGLGLPAYTVEATSGAPHARLFRVRCAVAALDLAAEAEGASRRSAEQAAAERLLADPRLRQSA